MLAKILYTVRDKNSYSTLDQKFFGASMAYTERKNPARMSARDADNQITEKLTKVTGLFFSEREI